jgi:antitoxin component of RelBE/YafQ-DinJ toxin-antitoxin module
MSEEVKNLFIKVRVSPKEKEILQKYCEEHNITISEFIRMNCFNKVKENK